MAQPPPHAGTWIACAAPLREVRRALRAVPALDIRFDICGTAHILLDPARSRVHDLREQHAVERAICSALEAAGLQYEAVRMMSLAPGIGSQREGP